MYYDTSTPDRKHQIVNFQDRYFHHHNVFLQYDRVCQRQFRNTQHKECRIQRIKMQTSLYPLPLVLK